MSSTGTVSPVQTRAQARQTRAPKTQGSNHHAVRRLDARISMLRQERIALQHQLNVMQRRIQQQDRRLQELALALQRELNQPLKKQPHKLNQPWKKQPHKQLGKRNQQRRW